MNKRNESLNIVQAVAALFVVFIHFPFPGRFGLITLSLARFSVPFFYVVSGYFFYRNNDKISFPFRKIIRLFFTLLVSELCYFLFYVFLQVKNIGFCIESITNVINGEFWNYYVKELPIRLTVLAPVFNGVGWFITSLILCYFLFWLLSTIKAQRILLISAPILLVFGIFLRVLFSLLSIRTPLPWDRSLLLLPLPFFCFGFILHKQKAYVQKCSIAKYIFIVVASIAAILIEQFFEDNTLYFGTPFLVIAVFCICIKKSDYVPHTLLGRTLSFLGANCGTFIYLMHMLIANILTTLTNRFPLFAAPVTPWITPILVYTITALSALVFYYVKCIIVQRKES